MAIDTRSEAIRDARESRANARSVAASRSGAKSGYAPRGQKVVGTTSYGSPIYEGVGNPISKGIQVTSNPEKWGATVARTGAYNSAARGWNNDLLMNNILGGVLPFGLRNVAPRYDQPATYTGGTYHFGMNPAAALASLGGLLIGPGAGPVLSAAAGGLYGAVGGKNLVFSGPDVPSGWTKYDSEPQSPQSQMAAAAPSPTRTGTGTQLLPPIAGNLRPPVINPTVQPPLITPPGTPPQQTNPGEWIGIPGPSPYGWRRPSWSF